MSDPNSDDSTSAPLEPGRPWPLWVATILLALTAAFMLWPPQYRFFLALEQHRKMILAYPITRDFINLSFYRDLDRQLPPDARIFFSGVVGPNDHLFPYYYARSVLFPREVEISLDHKADFQIEGFRGVDSASFEQLQTNGYDVMLRVGEDNHAMAFSLTPKGTLKQ